MVHFKHNHLLFVPSFFPSFHLFTPLLLLLTFSPSPPFTLTPTLPPSYSVLVYKDLSLPTLSHQPPSPHPFLPVPPPLLLLPPPSSPHSSLLPLPSSSSCCHSRISLLVLHSSQASLSCQEVAHITSGCPSQKSIEHALTNLGKKEPNGNLLKSFLAVKIRASKCTLC